MSLWNIRGIRVWPQHGALRKKLIDGGEVLMELDAYPFSEYYGWVRDKFGFSWQLILTPDDGEVREFIIPSLLFTDATGLRTEEALSYYADVFKDSKKSYFKGYQEGKLRLARSSVR